LPVTLYGPVEVSRVSRHAMEVRIGAAAHEFQQPLPFFSSFKYGCFKDGRLLERWLCLCCSYYFGRILEPEMGA